MTWSMHVTYLILTYLLMMEHFYLKISVIILLLNSLNSNNVYMYINNNHKNKKVITLVGNSSIKLLLVLQKGLINNRLTQGRIFIISLGGVWTNHGGV